MSAELDVALAAARAAGVLLLRHAEQGVVTEWKGRNDVVTAADREAELLVRDHVRAAFGDDLVVGEEGAVRTEAEVAGRRRWYVDPLDGTTNFVKGQPRWAVSVGFCGADDRMAAAAIHLPRTGETFAAVRGEGATRDGAPLRARDGPIHEALALLGPLDGLTSVVPRIGRQVLSLRITGSTVADLADVACGRADLYLGANQGRWDLAAGLLLCAEAGVVTTDLLGRDIAGPATEAFAATPSVHAALLAEIAAAAQRR